MHQSVVLKKTVESPLDNKEIKPVNLKGSQPWIFIGETDAEAPILWPPDVKNWLTGKDPEAGKDWGQEEKGATEDEMIAWHHWLNGCEFKQTPGDREGQGSLVCCSLRGCKESDTDWATKEQQKQHIYMTFYQIKKKQQQNTHFSSARGTLSRIDHVLGQNMNFSIFKKIKIISSIFSDHNISQLKISYKQKMQKHKHVEANQYATKQSIDHWRNQRKKQTKTWRQMIMKIQWSKTYGMQQKQF